MARTKGSSGSKTREAIRAAGLQLIHRHGFEASSLRQLAALVGIREGSLYNHIRSKQDLLFQLVEDHMDRLLAAQRAVIAPADPPPDRLTAFIRFHLTYHMQRPAEVFVINSELRSLEEPSRAIIIDKRDQYEAALKDIISDGIAKKCFQDQDVGLVAKAVLAMLTGVCSWFQPEGRLTVEAIVEIHTKLLLNGLIAPVSAAK